MACDPAAMREYKPDWVSPKKYEAEVMASPVRRAVMEAALLTQQKLPGQPSLNFPAVEDDFKDALEKQQEVAARTAYTVDEALSVVAPAAKARDQEPSRRWQAHYDLIRGRLMAMKVRCYEYNWACATMKKDPPKFQKPDSNAWKLVPDDEIHYSDKAAEAAKAARDLLKKVVDEHPGTPWALLAQRELKDPFGFKWVETHVKPVAQQKAEAEARAKAKKEASKPMARPVRAAETLRPDARAEDEPPWNSTSPHRRRATAATTWRTTPRRRPRRPTAAAARPRPRRRRRPAAEPAEAAATAAAPARPKKRRRRANRAQMSASWAISLVVHVAVLTALGLYTFACRGQEGGRQHQLGPGRHAGGVGGGAARPGRAGGGARHPGRPAARARRRPRASEGGGGGFGGIGTGPPSATPRVAGVGARRRPGRGAARRQGGRQRLGPEPRPVGVPAGVDLGGGGMIGGDVTYEAKDVGTALDQMAREILRHLGQHKLTVVWLFDESESMKDDQKAIRERFDTVASQLKVHVDDKKKQAAALTHAIVGFGEGIHYELKKPTADIDQIGEAIDHLKVDSSGTENTMHAIREVVSTYSEVISKDRRLLIVLVTDESGDDGDFVEEARQAVVSMKVPVYVIGRQSLFGFSRVRLRYVDPVTKDVYWPTIRRGPETADVEQLQWDGLHDRWDEQPSGFAPYELARLAKDTGGIYFLLPSEETLRNIRNREALYSMATLKEYVPDYEGRAAYVDRRTRSDFRRTMYEVILATKDFPFRRHFPVMPDPMRAVAAEAGQLASARLQDLIAIQKRLESLKKLRDREPDKRWQAHFDLMLAQIVVYQIKAYEYRALMAEMIKTPPQPKKLPSPDLVVVWEVNHAKQRDRPQVGDRREVRRGEQAARQGDRAPPQHALGRPGQGRDPPRLRRPPRRVDPQPQICDRQKLVPKY